MVRNMVRRSMLTGLVGVAMALGVGASQAAALTYTFSGSTTSDIPSLTGFSTLGDMMVGMSVTATFSDGSSETKSWAATGAGAGAATGTGWSLSESGDTFVAAGSPLGSGSGVWAFTNAKTSGATLLSLVLDGTTGLTVFDVDMYGGCISYVPSGSDDACSPGSARGSRVQSVDGYSAAVLYSDMVGIGGASPMGDLFHVVTLGFGAAGVAGSFTFNQDTDNDSRLNNQVPEPAALALVGLALAALGVVRRRSA